MNSMKKTILMMFSILVCLIYFWHDTAEARRFGGGRSFGSRPSYQRSTPAPSHNPSQNTGSPGMGSGQNSQQRPFSGMSSPFGRFGGMMGGLLMGGLIGSLLFGGGHGFGGPGLLDMLLIGGGLFLLFRFLRARRIATASPSPAGPISFDRGPAQGWENVGYSPSQAPVDVVPQAYPEGFDEAEFMKGANLMYTRLQESWDIRDLEDIRQFTTPEVFSEIAAQIQEDPNPGKTELLLINHRLIEVREVENQIIATVLFDVMIREQGDLVAKQVRELWHFSRAAGKPDSFWTLEGIQQVE